MGFNFIVYTDMQEITKKDAIKVMRRFDKNLNVTNKNIPFFHCLRDNLACLPGVPKGRKRRFWVFVRSMKGARGMRKENAFLFSLLPRARSRSYIPFSRCLSNVCHVCQRLSSYSIIVFIFLAN